MPERCDRPYAHHPHPYVDDIGVDRECTGGGYAPSLAELLATKPTVAGIGVGPARLELEVMCA